MKDSWITMFVAILFYNSIPLITTNCNSKPAGHQVITLKNAEFKDEQ